MSFTDHSLDVAPQIEHAAARLIELKFSDAAPVGTFSGYGAIFGNLDSSGDLIQRGAFAESLREWKAKGKLPPMLLQHGGGMFGGSVDDSLAVGQWTKMEENTRGLKVEGRLFCLDTPRGKLLYENLKSGSLDGLSIGFRTKKFTAGTKPTEPRRTLQVIDLWELSIVLFPANDKARVASVKSRLPTTIAEHARELHERGWSRAQATRLAGKGWPGLNGSQKDEDAARICEAANAFTTTCEQFLESGKD